MLKLTGCLLFYLFVAAAQPSYAASLGGRGRDAEAVAARRHRRSLPYGAADNLNKAGPDGPLDPFVDVNLVQKDDSKEDVTSLVAKLEKVKKSMILDYAQIEDKVAQINSQIKDLLMATPPPPPILPPINPAEVGPEAAEQQQSQQEQQQQQQQADTGASAAEQTPQADAPSPPEPSSPSSSSSSGPDNSNKEDGDGNGSNNNDNNAADPPAAAAEQPEENNNNNNNNSGGGETGGQQDSGAGAGDPPSPPTTPEPVPYEPPQSGNNVDFGNEDTKS